jgi:hypothetical protein
MSALSDAEEHARMAALIVYTSNTTGHPIARWNDAIDVYNQEIAAWNRRAPSDAVKGANWTDAPDPLGRKEAHAWAEGWNACLAAIRRPGARHD